VAGLDEKAAKVYLSALSLGTSSIQKIASQAEIKRPTAYLYIKQLLKEGLLETIPLGKKELYRATNPRMLEARVEQHLSHIKQLMPELESLKNKNEGGPSVRILEGEKGLQEVYRQITLASSICFWSDLASWEMYFHNEFNKISEAIREREIRTRELIPDTPEARRSSKRYSISAGKSYASRIATQGEIKNDSAIFGDTVALFRIQGYSLFVVLIEEPTIATTMKTIFNMAWECAMPFIGR